MQLASLTNATAPLPASPVSPVPPLRDRAASAIALLAPRQQLLATVRANLEKLDEQHATLAGVVRGVDAADYGTSIRDAIASARLVAPDAEPKLAAVEQGLDAAIAVLTAASTDTAPLDEARLGSFLTSLDPHFEAVVQAVWAVNPTFSIQA